MGNIKYEIMHSRSSYNFISILLMWHTFFLEYARELRIIVSSKIKFCYKARLRAHLMRTTRNINHLVDGGLQQSTSLPVT
jgi:hypothetical protein